MAENQSTSIMQFSEDLNSQEQPPLLPTGSYPAEIIGAEFKTSATSGNRYLSVQFRIDEANYPADYVDGDPDGTVLSYNRLIMEDKPMPRYRLKKFLMSIGAGLSRQFDPTDILGLSGTVEIAHEEYEGETRANIKRVITA